MTPVLEHVYVLKVSKYSFQIVESFDKLSNTTVVSPLQFLSTSSLRMITDPDQPIALVQHNGGTRTLW